MEQYRWHKGMRLRHPQEFRRVWAGGRSWVHPLLVLWALPNDLSYSRIGLTASRKVGNAVSRNRARRLLREAARHVYPEIVAGWDLLLVARSSLLRVTSPLVIEALRQTLQRAGLVNSLPEGVNV